MHIDIDEAMRYLGAAEGGEALRTQVSAAAERIRERPRYTYRVMELTWQDGIPFLPQIQMKLPGKTAKTMLGNCSQVVLLACTLGLSFDTFLSREQKRSMAEAVILDGCGSALVEQGCDAAEQEISSRFPGLYLTDRFSPGYGDLPLSLQKDLCAALDAQRRLGIYVNESMLMTPQKSVTALIGLSSAPQMARIRGCGYCSMGEHCPLRKGGKHCGL